MDCHEPILHEPLIGDGCSLEEACLHLFAYKYKDGIGSLLKEATSAGEKEGGGEKKSAFATAIGVSRKARNEPGPMLVGFPVKKTVELALQKRRWEKA